MPHKHKKNGKFEKVMKEFARGELRSSSGQKVKKNSQAVAIAFSEARRSMKS